MSMESEIQNEDELREEGLEGTSGICEQLEDFVVARPLKALCCAFVVGLLFGKLVL